jgi:hypothetical protein
MDVLGYFFGRLRFLQPLGKNWGRRSRGVENTQPHHLLMGLLAQVLLERFSLASTGAALAGWVRGSGPIQPRPGAPMGLVQIRR